MIHELSKSSYQKVEAIFSEISEYKLSVISVLEHNNLGKIFIDTVKNPKNAMMFYGNQSIVLVGDALNTTFNSKITSIIFRKKILDARKKGEESVVFYANDQWQPFFFLHVPYVKATPLRFYRFKEHKHTDWQNELPKKYEIVPIDKNLLEQDDLTYFNEVKDWVIGCFNDFETYLKHGYGFCAIYDEKDIASICLANFVSEPKSRCEIGILTNEEYRKKGLGKILTAQTVDYYLKRDFKSIEWHTRATNIPSIRTAESIGFELVREYNNYHLTAI
ncbi:MAG: GNAT family N-acetyltransferase [Asgard group archaeon]|nr:GNAT family N-acetyltransferase [Asgard group archaeon]